MLDCFYTDSALLYRCTTTALSKITGNGANPYRLRYIGPDKNNSGIYRCGAKNNLCLLSTEHSATGNPAFAFYRLLKFHFFIFTAELAEFDL